MVGTPPSSNYRLATAALWKEEISGLKLCLAREEVKGQKVDISMIYPMCGAWQRKPAVCLIIQSSLRMLFFSSLLNGAYFHC